MPQPLDIQKVIQTSTSNVSVDDLTKKGFKQVKVLNQAVITRLIAEAVDRVLEERAREISKEEREKVIKQAREQFETLAKRRVQEERSKLDGLEKANSSLLTEIESLRKRQSSTVEMQAELDRVLGRLRSLDEELPRLRATAEEKERQLSSTFTDLETTRKQCASRAEEVRVLQEKVDALQNESATTSGRLGEELNATKERLSAAEEKARAATAEKDAMRGRVGELESAKQHFDRELNRLEGEVRSKSAELESYRKRTSGHDEESTRLRYSLSEAEKRAAMLEGQLTAKEKELERILAQQSQPQSPPLAESLLQALTDKLDQIGKPSDVSDIKLSLDGLSRRLANMGSGGGGGSMGIGGLDSEENAFRLGELFSDSSEAKVESNVSKVKVKQAKAGGVNGALARLKKLQQGGEDGE